MEFWSADGVLERMMQPSAAMISVLLEGITAAFCALTRSTAACSTAAPSHCRPFHCRHSTAAHSTAAHSTAAHSTAAHSTAASSMPACHTSGQWPCLHPLTACA
ncbi:hypothetical protein CLOP_g2325 [Closterium sp. NIES-67]|nr:hypothetical protein CLOP_g2325 [Closterium sp. NIES-67]